MMTGADALMDTSRYITARAVEIEQLVEAGHFDRATADARLSELIIVQGHLGDLMEAEHAAAKQLVADILAGGVS